MFTGLNLLTECCIHCSYDKRTKINKKPFQISLVLDIILGFGAILTIFLINKGRGFDLPASIVKPVMYSGLAQCVLAIGFGFGLIAKNKI